jgi:hypothetical protein
MPPVAEGSSSDTWRAGTVPDEPDTVA